MTPIAIKTASASIPAAPGPHSSTTPGRNGHIESHNRHNELLRDFIIGFSDGLTVPFALTASLSSLGSARLVIVAGLAELFSGAISMGLGAYLAAVTERKHYEIEEAREKREVRECPREEEEEIFEILARYGVRREEASGVVEALKQDEDMWVRFMMDFELRLEKPKSKGAFYEGLVMGVAYFIGGLLPMIPYFAFGKILHALFTSIGITVFILAAFGYGKAAITGCTRREAVRSALHTMLVGILAAGISFGIVKLVSSRGPPAY